VEPPDTILEEDHQITILSKFGSAVALLLKAALIQVSDYRLLRASGFTKEHQCPTPDELNFFSGSFNQ
jgi:hypothetical protein